MSKKSNQVAVPDEVILNKIYLIRGQKVMLDSDLAELYQVETKRLNERVKRSKDRFPKDFMFQLTKKEWEDLKSQNATSSWGGRRTPPYSFTEHGVLMLSSVLNSERAIQVNILIMRAYTKMREVIMSNKDILLKMEQVERKLGKHDQQIAVVFKYLQELEKQKQKPKLRPSIGFKSKKKS